MMSEENLKKVYDYYVQCGKISPLVVMRMCQVTFSGAQEICNACYLERYKELKKVRDEFEALALDTI